jgi:hypothetical protein
MGNYCVGIKGLEYVPWAIVALAIITLPGVVRVEIVWVSIDGGS